MSTVFICPPTPRLPAPDGPIGIRGLRLTASSVPCHPAPGWAVGRWPSLSGNTETGCYLWGWTGPDRFVETSKMVAFLQVIRTPALTETAKCLSPAPSFCFQNGMGLSASSYYICASMQMMNLGFLRVLTPCSPIPD